MASVNMAGVTGGVECHEHVESRCRRARPGTGCRGVVERHEHVEKVVVERREQLLCVVGAVELFFLISIFHKAI